jgi:hypothetical protein
MHVNTAMLALQSAKLLPFIMSNRTWLQTVGTRLKGESKDTRPVRVAIAVDNIDDEKKERSLNDCKLRAGDIVRLALPDFRPEPYDAAFKLEKIEKPEDDDLIALTGVPMFRDGKIYELRN